MPPFMMTITASKWKDCISYYEHFEKLSYYRDTSPYAAHARIFSVLPGIKFGTFFDKVIPLECVDWPSAA